LASYDFPDMMPLAGMMPAFILEDLGRFREARAIIEKAQQRFAGRLSPDDDKFIHNYLDYLATRE
jgi:glutathione S-transferase